MFNRRVSLADALIGEAQEATASLRRPGRFSNLLSFEDAETATLNTAKSRRYLIHKGEFLSANFVNGRMCHSSFFCKLMIRVDLFATAIASAKLFDL